MLQNAARFFFFFNSKAKEPGMDVMKRYLNQLGKEMAEKDKIISET